MGTGRDVAVCYANRAATRLMLAAESTAAGGGVRRGVAGKNVNAFENGDVNKNKNAAAETRLALADCRAALRADAGFDRARLRAGTCLVRLGAFAAAEAAPPRRAAPSRSRCRRLVFTVFSRPMDAGRHVAHGCWFVVHVPVPVLWTFDL